MRNNTDKICRENQNTHFVFNNHFFLNVAYEIMWKNTVEPDRTQMKIRRISIAYWILMATDTHSEYVIPIASPRQKWLWERASVLRLYIYYLFFLLLIRSDCQENNQRSATRLGVSINS
jgi:hypothetical protein